MSNPEFSIDKENNRRELIDNICQLEIKLTDIQIKLTKAKDALDKDKKIYISIMDKQNLKDKLQKIIKHMHCERKFRKYKWSIPTVDELLLHVTKLEVKGHDAEYPSKHYYEIIYIY